MNRASRATSVFITLLASACTVGPDYHRPAVEVPKNYKEQAAAAGWRPAAPADDLPRGAWWSIYKDKDLDALETQVAVNNQNLKASEAAYRQAVAALAAARAGFFPVVTASASAARGQTGQRGSVNSLGLSGDVTWELDVWGRIRRQVESNQAAAQASAADLASATLSNQSLLAQDYFELRSTDQLQRLLSATVRDYTEAFMIAQNQYNAGIVARADVAQAQTQIDATKAQDINTGIQRAQLEHAIAVLIGKPPAELSLPVAADLALPPPTPIAVPSAILQRRPDVAAAERRVKEDNAQIGVAIAAFYPDLTLDADYGFTGAAFGSLLNAANRAWSVGPQLAETLFNGGARTAAVAEAQATYDQEVALYRQTVLTSFQQVEDQLVASRLLAQQYEVEVQAVKDAQLAEALTLNQYKAGVIDFTTVITTQTAALSNQQAALTVAQDRLTASVQLVEALGGGWDAASLPNP